MQTLVRTRSNVLSVERVATERWAWFAIAVGALIVHGGQWASDVVTDGGLRNYTVILGSGSLVFAGIIATLLLNGAGRALTWSSSRL